MLVPSGNDAAYVLAYHIAKNELGEGYTATEYIDYFMTCLLYTSGNSGGNTAGTERKGCDVCHRDRKLSGIDFGEYRV